MRALRLCLVVFLAAPFPVAGATFAVNNFGDAAEGAPGDGICDLGEGVCTLRAAIQEANATPGPDLIVFDNTGTILLDGQLPDIAEQVTINGASAPGYAGTPLVVLDGSSATPFGLSVAAGGTATIIDALKFVGFTTAAILSDATGVIIRRNHVGPVSEGLANALGILLLGNDNTIGGADGEGNVVSGNSGRGIEIQGMGHVLRDNIIGLDETGASIAGNGSDGIFVNVATNITIGSATAGEGNVISGNGGSGIEVNPSAGPVVIIGNTIGLDIAQTSTRGNGLSGVRVSNSSGVTIGGTGTSLNVISGNSLNGIEVLSSSSNVEISGNRIGTNGAGTAAEGNLGPGIEIDGVTDVTVSQNLISGNGGAGVDVLAGAVSNTIHQNVIGRSLDLSMAIPNTGGGIRVQDANDNTIGSMGLGNTISGNAVAGVAVVGTSTGNAIAFNSISDNTGLGIDLNLDGISPNDANDADPGPNGLQNFPDITSAVSTGAASQIQGTLNSTPDTNVALHFYSSVAADPSMFGEGESYIGTTMVLTDGSGNATFDFAGPPLASGLFVTVTATGPAGTSEFSEAVAVELAPSIQFSSATYSVGESDGMATITVTRSGNLDLTSMVNYATANNTAIAGSDYVAASGTLTFVPGDASEEFTVPIISDLTDEPDRIVDLTLSAFSAASPGEPVAAQLTITDDDGMPTISIDDVSQNEGNAATTSFVFTVTLSNAAAANVTVDFATADGSATTPADYAPASGTATILAGSLSTTITVDVSGDTTFEADESFTVTLTNPSANATIADGTGTGTIVNDDVAGTGADLAVTKTGPINVISGVPFDYVVTVSNLGPLAATNVVMTDPLPPVVTLVSATPSQGTCSGTTIVTCNLGTIASGASATITIRVVTNMQGGLSPNSASATATEPDPNPLNNTGSVITTVPTLSQWMLIVLALSLAAIALVRR